MLEGWKPTDVEPPGGEALGTLWTPQLVQKAREAKKVKKVSNPLTFLAQLVEGTGGEGAASAEAEAEVASPGPVVEVQQLSLIHI